MPKPLSAKAVPLLLMSLLHPHTTLGLRRDHYIKRHIHLKPVLYKMDGSIASGNFIYGAFYDLLLSANVVRCV